MWSDSSRPPTASHARREIKLAGWQMMLVRASARRLKGRVGKRPMVWPRRVDDMGLAEHGDTIRMRVEIGGHSREGARQEHIVRIEPGHVPCPGEAGDALVDRRRLARVRTGPPIGESRLVPPDHRGRIVPRTGVENGDPDVDAGLGEHAVEGLAEKASLVEARDGDRHARKRTQEPSSRARSRSALHLLVTPSSSTWPSRHASGRRSPLPVWLSGTNQVLASTSHRVHPRLKRIRERDPHKEISGLVHPMPSDHAPVQTHGQDQGLRHMLQIRGARDPDHPCLALDLTGDRQPRPHPAVAPGFGLLEIARGCRGQLAPLPDTVQGPSPDSARALAERRIGTHVESDSRCKQDGGDGMHDDVEPLATRPALLLRRPARAGAPSPLDRTNICAATARAASASGEAGPPSSAG